MTRRAVLIEASGIKGEKDYLPGAVVDVDNFKEFLTADCGGAWEANEIVILRNPTRAETLTALAAAKLFDYSFVTASGHGYHTAGSLGQTKFHLKGKDEISANELNTGSNRCTVILDCCRKITQPTAVQFSEARLRMAKSARVQMPRAAYRRAFDKALERTEDGCSYFYSCALNQAAQEDANGGYYSHDLVVSGRRWHDESNSIPAAVFDVMDAHLAAAKLVTAKEPKQTPDQQAGRRKSWFPFAVYP